MRGIRMSCLRWYSRRTVWAVALLLAGSMCLLTTGRTAAAIPGSYDGTDAQGGRITLTVAPNGHQLTFMGVYNVQVGTCTVDRITSTTTVTFNPGIPVFEYQIVTSADANNVLDGSTVLIVGIFEGNSVSGNITVTLDPAKYPMCPETAIAWSAATATRILPPPTPATVSVVANGDLSVTVTWTAPSGIVDGYAVHVDVHSPAGDRESTAFGAWDSTAYTLTAAFPADSAADSAVCATVEAFNGAGYSPWSDWVCVTTPALGAGAQ